MLIEGDFNSVFDCDYAEVSEKENIKYNGPLKDLNYEGVGSITIYEENKSTIY